MTRFCQSKLSFLSIFLNLFLYLLFVFLSSHSVGKGPLKLSLSVGQYFSWSVGPLSVFSKMAYRILRKLYMKLEGLNGQKLMEPNFSEKFSFWGKRPKFPQNYSFLAFSKN